MPRPKKLSAKIDVRRTQCATCVFKRECEGGLALAPHRRAKIEAQVLSGNNQLCHHDNDKTICKGGRDYVLIIWHRMGLIESATAKALNKKLASLGLAPRWREN